MTQRIGAIALVLFGLAVAGIVVREQNKERLASLTCAPTTPRVVLSNGTIGCPLVITDEAKK